MVKQTNLNTPSQRPDLFLSQVQLGPAEIEIVPTTPRTPADEGKDFFLSERSVGEQRIRVYELRLDPDGGPDKQRSASPPSRSLRASTYSRPHSIFVSHLPMSPTYYASLWMRGHPPRKMVYLKPTSRSTVACSSGTGSRVESERGYLTG